MSDPYFYGITIVQKCPLPKNPEKLVKNCWQMQKLKKISKNWGEIEEEIAKMVGNWRKKPKTEKTENIGFFVQIPVFYFRQKNPV